MNKLRDKKEEEAPAAKTRKATTRTGGSVRVPRLMIGVLNGSFLTREKVLGNMPFILFCAGLMITYIAYGYHTERVVRDLHRTDSELKELRSEYITVRAQLEKAEQQSQVASGIGQLGLKESRVPPVKLEVEEDRLERTRP
ncbi:MAG: FtsL-like putative cell division protein [Flavobacteriales bacterium]